MSGVSLQSSNFEGANMDNVDNPSLHDDEGQDLSVSQNQIFPSVPPCSVLPSSPTPFDDSLGKNVLDAFHNLEENVGKLKQNLEKQFNDSEVEDDEEDEDTLELDESLRQQIESSRLASFHRSDSSTSSGEDAQDMEDLINVLNRHDHILDEKSKPRSGFFASSSGKRGKYSPSDSDDLDNDDDEEESSSASSNSRGNHNFVGKIFDLINTLQHRETIPTVDEWDNDDDAGYITISLSEQEFVEFEESNAYRWFLDRESIKANPSSHANNDLSIKLESNQSNSAQSTLIGQENPSNVLPMTAPSMFDGHFGAPSIYSSSFQAPPDPSTINRRQSMGERRRNEIIGQHKFQGADGIHCFFNLKVIFEPYRTGFEESKDLKHPKGTIIAGRYEVYDVLGQAAFSTALQCIDLAAEENEAQWVCLKVIKNNKDFFDQSLDEIKLLQYINSNGDPDRHHVLRLIDFFYCKEHLFIVSELLKENLYEFGRYIRENMLEQYYTLPRLKRISKQVLEALAFIHSLKLIHCDVKPENIVIKSFSRCEVKLIDFGSSCFTTDHLTTYIQSRSYRAPEVIIGHPYDSRIDIWSVGAVLAELYTGYVLFQNDSVPTMLSRISGVMGPFPKHVLQNGKDTGKYFTTSNIVYERDEEGTFHLIFPKQTNLTSRLHFHHHHSGASLVRKIATSELEDEEQFVDFVRAMLNLDPAKRVTAIEALQHPWLNDADTVQFKEYIIGQPAQPHQSYGQHTSDPEALEEDENGEDEIDESETDKALFYAKYPVGGEAEEDFEVDEEDEDEESADNISFEKSTFLDDLQRENGVTLEDDLTTYENELQNSYIVDQSFGDQ